MNEISSLIKETQRVLSPLLPREDMKETAIHEPGSRPSPDTESASALIRPSQPPEL